MAPIDLIENSMGSKTYPSKPSEDVTETLLILEDLNNDPYTVEFEGETLYIDSLDWRKSYIVKLQISAVAITFILFGLGEQATGTLIPILQKEYKVNDVQTSFIYLASISGYILMGILNGHTHKAIGLKGVLLTGTSSMAFAYLVFSRAPPFYVLVMFAVFSGIGCGVLDAACNTWAGSLVDSNPILGILHGFYGLGSLLSPSVITHLLEKENPWRWNNYYLLLSIMAMVDFSLALFCFRYETAKKYKYILKMKLKKEIQLSKDIEMQDFNDNDLELDISDVHAGLTEVIQNPLTWLIALVLFIYTGAEVGFGAWLITFLTRINKIPYKQASHIATTFWAGLTCGRTVLGFATGYFKNELYANYTYIGLSSIGILIFYFVSLSSVVPLIFAVVFCTGIVVGPVYSTTITSTIGILPSKYHASGIGFICAVGGSGAAAIPFSIGAVAEASLTGLKVYPLFMLGLCILLFIVWTYIIRRFGPSYVSWQV